MQPHRYALAGFRAFVCILIASLILSACVVQRSPVTGRKRAYGYTWAQERQIGQEADQQIIAQYGVYEDPELLAYVERVGQKVLEVSHLRRPSAPAEIRETPVVFRVLDSPIVNAFALPGGFVYVTRGLLAHLQNEAQLAVVLGHEVGHIAARHASQRAVESQVGQLGVLGGAILGGAVLGGEAAQNILNLGSQAAQLLFLSYGRDDERESDALGVEYAAVNRYQAAEAAAFFASLERIGKQQGGEIPSFLSTHPDPGERRQTIPRLAAQYDMGGASGIVQTQEYLQAIKNTVVGENPRQGFVEGGVFYHPELRFRFPVPSGFQVVNQPSQVALVAAEQDAFLVFQIAQGSSAQAAAQAFAGQQGIKVVEQGAVRNATLPAYTVVAQAQMEGGQQVGVLAYFVEYESRVYSFTGVSTAQRFSHYDDVFAQVARGFASERNQAILSVQPWVLDVVPASRTAAFRTFVPANLPTGMTPEDLAIMNQVALDEVVEAGTLLKLPKR